MFRLARGLSPSSVAGIAGSADSGPAVPAAAAGGCRRSRTGTGPPENWAMLRYLAGISKTAPAAPDDSD
jgi:hypothetical protein